MCETGDGRRTRLRGLEKVTKRYLIQAAARNLGVILRKLFGMGTPRGATEGAQPRFWPTIGRSERDEWHPLAT